MRGAGSGVCPYWAVEARISAQEVDTRYAAYVNWTPERSGEDFWGWACHRWRDHGEDLRCAAMSEPPLSPRVEVTCLRCGREVTRWVVVLWQYEHDHDGDVEVIGAETLAILCLLCVDEVQEAVRAAVDRATG